MFREELQLLQEPGSYVGQVVKIMRKSKVLVKVILSTLQSVFHMNIIFCLKVFIVAVIKQSSKNKILPVLSRSLC
jgi:hypothetical protein